MRARRAPRRWAGSRSDGRSFDSCPAHGTWFDREEIATVITACGALRRAHADEEGSPEEAAYRAVEREGREPQFYSESTGSHGAVWSLFGTVLEIVAAFLG